MITREKNANATKFRGEFGLGTYEITIFLFAIILILIFLFTYCARLVLVFVRL